MPYVSHIPVGRIVMTWIWSFSCDVSMKNVLKFVWLFSGIVWLYVQMSIWQPCAALFRNIPILWVRAQNACESNIRQYALPQLSLALCRLTQRYTVIVRAIGRKNIGPACHVARMVRTRTVHRVLVGKQQGKNHIERQSVDGTIILKLTWVSYSQEVLYWEESDCDVEGKGASMEQNLYLEEVFMHHTTEKTS
jgi:hypothetical protein